jgi:hypothetical protein
MKSNIKKLSYYWLSNTKILEKLSQAGRAPEVEFIEFCLGRPDLIPGLLQMLAAEIDRSWPESDPRYYALVHAGLLLTGFKEPRALPYIARILRDESRADLMEWFITALPNYGHLATEMALELLTDPSTPPYTRSYIVDALTAIGWHHPPEQARILPALRALLPPLAEDGTLILPPGSNGTPDPMWSWITCALADLRDRVSQPQVLALYEQQLIDEKIIGGVYNYMSHFEPGAESPPVAEESAKIKHIYTALHSEAVWERDYKAYLAGTLVRPQPPPVGPPQALKVGRNDSCPCGSGRKYKSCCGAKGRSK